ncbi:hypothetical protein BH11VER1_BH11VER1_17180 [soil metagenome]
MKTSRFRHCFLGGFLLLLSLLFTLQPLQAATYYWDNNSTAAGFGTAGGTWGTNNFWTTDATGVVAPGSAATINDDLNFGTNVYGLAAGTVAVTGTVNAKSITFGSYSGAVLLSGGTITLGGTGQITSNNASDTIGSVITGSVGLNKLGTGTLTLTGVNNYTGLTTISAGVLNIQNASALGNVSSGTLVSTGAALEIQGGIAVGAEALTLNGTGINNGGALRNISGNNSFAGLLTLGSATRINSDTVGTTLTLSNTGTITGATFGLTVGGAGNTLIAGIIGTTSGTLTKDGTGTLTLSGANTFTGATTVNGGGLNLNYATQSNSKLSDSAALTLGGGALDLSGGAALHNEVVFSTAIASGASSVTRSSGNTVLRMKAITRSSGGTVNFGAAGIADTDTTNTNGILGGWATLNGTDWAMNSGGLDGSITAYANGSYTNVTRFNGTKTITSNAASNVRITEGSGGSNTSITPTAVGTTDINTLLQSASGGTGAATYDPGTTDILRLGVAGGILLAPTSGALTIGASANDGFLTAGGAASTAGEIIVHQYSSNNLTINSSIANNGIGVVSLTLAGTGAGTTILNGANTHTGDTTVNKGTLALGNINALQNSTLNTGAAGTQTVTFTAPGTNTYNLGGLKGADALAIGANTMSVGSNNQSTTYSGVVSSTGGGLTKAGTGILTLTGTNTYTGDTTINGGTLAFGVGGSISSSSMINLQGAGAILDLTPIASQVAGISGRMFSYGAGGNTSTFDTTQGGITPQSVPTLRTDANLNYGDLKAALVSPAIAPADNNLIQWMGQIRITAGGDYKFGTSSDDGSRLWIDGVLLVNNDGGKPPADSFNTVNLSAGLHDVRIDYTNGTGGAAEVFRYGGTDTANAYVAVPTTVLYRAEKNTTAADGISTALQLGNNLNVTANSTINLNGTEFTQVQFGTLTIAGGNNLTIGGLAGKTMRVGATTFSGSGSITLDSSLNIAVDGVVSDGGVAKSIIKTGTGRLIFSQTTVANTLLAGTTLDMKTGSTLVLIGRGDAAVRGFLNPIGAAGIRLDGGNLELDSNGFNISQTVGPVFNNAVAINDNATIKSVLNVANITLGSATNGITFTNNSKTLTLDAIAGGQPVGAGRGATLTIAGDVNSNGFTGSVIAIQSTQLGSYSAAESGVVRFTNDPGTGILSNYLGDFKFTGAKSTTIYGSVFGSPDNAPGAFSLQKKLTNYTVTVDSGITGTIAAQIKESTLGTGNVGITKVGSGTLLLKNVSNTYNGTTVINGGVLQVTNVSYGGVGNPSSIGSSSNAAANLVLNGGTLSYVGNINELFFTDRSFTLGSAAGSALSADGQGVGGVGMIFGIAGDGIDGEVVDVTTLNPGVARVLTLTGANTDNNQFGLVLQDSGAGATSIVKSGVGTWIMTESNSYTGATTVNSGTLATVINGGFGTGTVAVNSGAILELRGVNYTTATGLTLNAGGTLSAIYDTGVIDYVVDSNSTWAGDVNVAGAAIVKSAADAILILSGNITGIGAITQVGTGPVTLSGKASLARDAASGASYTLQSGTLILDYTAGFASTDGKLSNNSLLILGGSKQGGTVELRNGAGKHVEIVSGVTLNPGANYITRSSGTSVLRMNTIKRNLGATIQFSGGGVASTDNKNDASGILGAWATVGLDDWAAKSTTTNDTGTSIMTLPNVGVTGGVEDGLIVQYTGYLSSSDPANWLAGNNLTVDATSNPGPNKTANTLRFYAPDPSDLEQTVTLTGPTNKLASGGILVGANMGTTSAVIAGPGSLTGEAVTGGDLIIIQNNVTAPLEFKALIANNGTNGTGVDKTGLGNLILSGNSTYTGATTLNDGVTTVRNITNGGIAGGLGASSNGVDRLVFNGGTLQLNAAPGTMTTDRGFTVAESAVWDIGNENTTLSLSGLYATPLTVGDYAVVKIGSGTLLWNRPTTALTAGNWGVTKWDVSDGTTILMENVDNQYARSDAQLTLSGGKLTIIGDGTTSRLINMTGAFTVGEGSSILELRSDIDINPATATVLTLQNTTTPTDIRYEKGSTLLIKEDSSSGAAAIIQIAGGYSDLAVVMPRIVYQSSTDTSNPGVNYFAVIDPTGFNVVGSDFGGTNKHNNVANVAAWAAVDNVTDGADADGSIGKFYGTIATDETVNTIRFFNNSRGDQTLASPDTPDSTVTIASGKTLTLKAGAILQTTHSGNIRKSIEGGSLKSTLYNYDADGFITSADLIVHNWNPLRSFEISSVIVNDYDYAPASPLDPTIPLNFIQSGNGTTVLSGANTYSGTTFVQGGVLRLNSANALPNGIVIATEAKFSHLRLDGGVLGLGFGDFTRGLGLGSTQVDWTSSGGFAAYTADRIVNLGGASATVEWGAGFFVPDNDTFILGAYDADKTIDFKNGINLGRKDRMIRAADGTALIDGKLSGVISGSTGTLVKTGQGGLELAAANTYVSGTTLAQGLLVGSTNTAFGTGAVRIGTTADSRAMDAVELRFTGSILANAITVGDDPNFPSLHTAVGNTESISTIRTTATAAMNGVVTLQKTNSTFIAPASATTASYSNITGTRGFTLIDGGTLSLANANTYGASANGPGASVNGGTIIRNGTILLGNNLSLNSTTVELGDATYSKTSVFVATNGRSVLGVENTYSATSNGIASLGGAFVATGNGLRDGTGGVITTGSGAFYNVSSSIDGQTLTTLGQRVLIKDETEHPERNGIYEVTAINATDEVNTTTTTVNLTRVSDFNETTEMLYGSQVTVTAGTSNSGKTFFMASPDITIVNGTNDPSQWLQDTSANPNVSLYANAATLNISNALDVNANGSGTTTIGTTNGLYTGVVFSGAVKLQDVQSSVAEFKILTLASEATTNPGVLFSGLFSEGAVDDILSINKSGSGVATLSNTNTYKGTTMVQTGTLRITTSSALGDVAGGTTVMSGATLELAPGSGSLTVGNEALNISGTGVSGTAGAVNVSAGAANTWGGGVTLAADSTINTASGAQLSFTGIVTGGSALNKIGVGTLVLSGANDYTGATNVTAGTLKITHNTALGTVAGGTTVSNNATLEIDGTIANLNVGSEALNISGTGVSSVGAVNVTGGSNNTWGGTVTMAANSTVNVATLTKLSFTNVVSGTAALTKSGLGILELSGSNLYSGTTNVSAGTLLINNIAGSGTGTGAVNVSSGATLGGNGSINAGANNVTLSSGSVLSVGTPGSGVAEDFNITTSGAGVIMLSGELNFDLYTSNQSAALNPTTANDRLILAAATSANITGSTLKVNSALTLTAANYTINSTWDLIDWTALAPTGTFSNVTAAQGNFAGIVDISSLNLQWDFTKLYTLGQISVVASVPEPGRMLLLFVGLAALVSRRRRPTPRG